MHLGFGPDERLGIVIVDIDPIVVVRVVEEGKDLVEKNKGIASLTLPEALDYLVDIRKSAQLM